MLMMLCLALCFFSMECRSDPARRLRVEQIDQRIEELEEKKRGYEAQALRAEDQAIRLQFEDRYIVETRQYNQVAEGFRNKAKQVQGEIDRLKQERAQLLEA